MGEVLFHEQPSHRAHQAPSSTSLNLQFHIGLIANSILTIHVMLDPEGVLKNNSYVFQSWGSGKWKHKLKHKWTELDVHFTIFGLP